MMMTLPSLKMPPLANTLLAVLGLAAVVALSVPDLSGGTRWTLDTTLVVIWGIYVLQLAATVLARPAHELRSEGAALAVDLLAVIVPLAFLLTGGRDQSLFCGIWVLKPLRDSTSFRLVGKVLANEARNLIGVMSIFGIVLFVAALAAYLIERDAQPQQFGSIPLAMWWAVVTLSTTGYGDEIPQSLAGRVLAGVVMMSGIGVFALWAGLLATGFAEEVRRQDFVRKWQLVSAVPLFQKLGSAELVGIVRALKPRNLSAGAVICRKGEAGDQMFFIVEGHVSVATPSPVELGPGTFFGEMALITGEPRSATVVASSAVSLLSLHSLDFQVLSSRNPEIAEIIRQTALERRGINPKS
jgi:voltage-gated potassium channel